jgi:hypothetical protein
MFTAILTAVRMACCCCYCCCLDESTQGDVSGPFAFDDEARKMSRNRSNG